ncbi:hypothetical protein YC2023_061265 [Brassica napus]
MCLLPAMNSLAATIPIKTISVKHRLQHRHAPAAARKSTVVMIKIIESEAKVTANDFRRHKKLDAVAAKIFSVPSTAPASSVLRYIRKPKNRHLTHKSKKSQNSLAESKKHIDITS